MNKIIRKIILALVIVFSSLQLSFTFFMSLHAHAEQSCEIAGECLFEAYISETDAAIFNYFLLFIPAVVLFFVLSQPALRASVSYQSPSLNYARQFLKGVLQRE